MKLTRTSLLIVLFALLTGCAQSTTQSDFDCPVNNGVPACLDTYDVDVQGDIPKSAAGVGDTGTDAVERITDEKTKDAVEDKKVVVTSDTTYPVQPLVKQPVRQFGSTERMWFAPWQDKKNDLYIDQQFVYWAEKGEWIISGGSSW